VRRAFRRSARSLASRCAYTYIFLILARVIGHGTRRAAPLLRLLAGQGAIRAHVAALDKNLVQKASPHLTGCFPISATANASTYSPIPGRYQTGRCMMRIRITRTSSVTSSLTGMRSKISTAVRLSGSERHIRPGLRQIWRHYSRTSQARSHDRAEAIANFRNYLPIAPPPSPISGFPLSIRPTSPNSAALISSIGHAAPPVAHRCPTSCGRHPRH